MLCLLAERVLHAVRVFRMLMSRLAGECHADVTPHRLPGGEIGIAEKEQQQQEQHIDAEAAARAAVIVAAARTATALALILRRPEGSPHPEEPPQAASRRVEGTRVKSQAPAAAVIVAAGVAARATRAPRASSVGPLIQKANLPAAAAPAEPAAAAASSKIGFTTLEADEVRVPREGGGPVITSRLALLWSCSRKLEQASKSALGSRFRGRNGSRDLRP
jgi:hypothetical protein